MKNQKSPRASRSEARFPAAAAAPRSEAFDAAQKVKITFEIDIRVAQWLPLVARLRGSDVDELVSGALASSMMADLSTAAEDWQDEFDQLANPHKYPALAANSTEDTGAPPTAA